MNNVMTVAEVRQAIKTADHIFIQIDLVPYGTTSRKLKVGRRKAADLFKHWHGSTQVLASYNTRIVDCKMLFIGSLRGAKLAR